MAGDPRGFARGVGAVLQFFGVVLTFGSCCWWSFAGLTQERIGSSSALMTVADVVGEAGATRLWGMGAVVVSFVGGLALAALGLGIQAEKRRATRAAAIVAWIGAAFWLARLIWVIVTAPGFGRIVAAALMAIAWGLCGVLALVAGDELRRNPPPPDQGAAPADMQLDRAIDREMPSDLREPPGMGG